MQIDDKDERTRRRLERQEQRDQARALRAWLKAHPAEQALRGAEYHTYHPALRPAVVILSVSVLAIGILLPILLHGAQPRPAPAAPSQSSTR